MRPVTEVLVRLLIKLVPVVKAKVNDRNTNNHLDRRTGEPIAVDRPLVAPAKVTVRLNPAPLTIVPVVVPQRSMVGQHVTHRRLVALL
uniref:Putative secreted peptide n=1 Tax=Anopheles braziliensis TaxID=58242 RepID=A0A2M3ZWQ8_9DIPT